MIVAFVGIDLAKNVFQLHGVTSDGQPVLKRRVRREGVLWEIAEMASCIIGVEACTGAFYWQRQFEALGHMRMHFSDLRRRRHVAGPNRPERLIADRDVG